jgi:cytochrome P450
MVRQSEHIITVGPDGAPKRYALPAGTRVYLNAPAVHYHPKYWPDPYKLDPNRWRISPGGGKHVVASDRTRQMKGTLLTFSDGSRACLGRKFAQAEYIAFFVALLRQYRVNLGPGSDPAVVERDLFGKSAGTITLAPLGDVCLRIQLRESSTQG